MAEKHVIMALTNVDRYLGTAEERRTGVWLEEAATFYEVMRENGIRVTFASTNGGAVPIDPASLHADPETLRTASLPEFREGMENTIRLAELDPAGYDALYFCGGHGAMWDFPDNKVLETLAERIYAAGGRIASVCHGEAGLVHLKDSAGNPLVRGKKINGFTNEEEQANGTNRLVPLSPEDELIRDGAKFVKGAPFTEFAVEDGQFVTGQNPMSARKVAELLAASLQKGE